MFRGVSHLSLSCCTHPPFLPTSVWLFCYSWRGVVWLGKKQQGCSIDPPTTIHGQASLMPLTHLCFAVYFTRIASHPLFLHHGTSEWRDLHIMYSTPILEMRKLRATKESDWCSISQSGSRERTFTLASKRSHCSFGIYSHRCSYF